MTILVPTHSVEITNNSKRPADRVFLVSDPGQYQGFRRELVDDPSTWQLQVHLWDPAEDTKVIEEHFANGRKQRVHYKGGRQVERVDVN